MPKFSLFFNVLIISGTWKTPIADKWEPFSVEIPAGSYQALFEVDLRDPAEATYKLDDIRFIRGVCKPLGKCFKEVHFPL